MVCSLSFSGAGWFGKSSSTGIAQNDSTSYPGFLKKELVTGLTALKSALRQCRNAEKKISLRLKSNIQ